MTEKPEVSHVHGMARDYAERKWVEREAEARRKEIGKELIEGLRTLNMRKVKVDFNQDQDATVSIKKRENTTVNPDKLKKKLGARAYNKLTTPVLDESKIEAAIKLGDLDPNVVSACMETTETEYLEARFTKKRRRS